MNDNTVEPTNRVPELPINALSSSLGHETECLDTRSQPNHAPDAIESNDDLPTPPASVKLKQKPETLCPGVGIGGKIEMGKQSTRALSKSEVCLLN